MAADAVPPTNTLHSQSASYTETVQIEETTAGEHGNYPGQDITIYTCTVPPLLAGIQMAGFLLYTANHIPINLT